MENMSSLEEHFEGGDLFSMSSLLTPSGPVSMELNRLQNLLKEKERELGYAQSEIKSLKAADVLKEKAIEELKGEVDRLEHKVRANESLLENKNLEIKRLTSEKKDALAGQCAAEATLRRVHASQKDDDLPPIESILAPLEAELKIHKNEIAALQEDNKALERHTKSKELALVEAERILRSALERALIVEEVQNHNYELKRQIEICLEENRILEKTNRQKVLEVEKLSQTIEELEEAILASGATANTIRDYRRQISQLHEEKRTLERELARVKVLANRVATVVANEWKDENDKVMPVRQWLEERKLFQAEMQKLREKLAISERTAKAEAQLKEKMKRRLKTLEDELRGGVTTVQTTSPTSPNNNNKGSPKRDKATHIFGILTRSGSGAGIKRSTSQPRGSTINRRSSPIMGRRQDEAHNNNNNVVAGKRGLWVSSWNNNNKVVDSSTGKENNETINPSNATTDHELNNKDKEKSGCIDDSDMVSGFLYDKLQKDVISLRKFCESKDGVINAKDQQITMLMKKVDALTKAIEVETKKHKREAAARDKEAVRAAAAADHDNKRNTKLPILRVTSKAS